MLNCLNCLSSGLCDNLTKVQDQEVNVFEVVTKVTSRFGLMGAHLLSTYPFKGPLDVASITKSEITGKFVAK